MGWEDVIGRHGVLGMGQERLRVGWGGRSSLVVTESDEALVRGSL